MMKFLGTLLQTGSMLLIIGVSFWVGWQSHSAYGTKPDDGRVPTIQEIQTLVGAKPDGKIGAETLTKWDAAVCNQEARRWFVKQ